MEIDLGAIAKGYIADVIKLVLQQHKVYQAIVNLGGNVLTIGDSPIDAEGYWHIGLKKPFSSIENELVGLIKVKNKSVVTSGIYERYFIENQHVYHHIRIHPLREIFIQQSYMDLVLKRLNNY